MPSGSSIIVSSTTLVLWLLSHVLLFLIVVPSNTVLYPLMHDNNGDIYPDTEGKLDIRNLFHQAEYGKDARIRDRSVESNLDESDQQEPLSTENTVAERNMDLANKPGYSRFGWTTKRGLFMAGGYTLLGLVLCVVVFFWIRHSIGSSEQTTAKPNKGAQKSDKSDSDSSGSDTSGGGQCKGGPRKRKNHKKNEQINQRNRKRNERRRLRSILTAASSGGSSSSGSGSGSDSGSYLTSLAVSQKRLQKIERFPSGKKLLANQIATWSERSSLTSNIGSSEEDEPPLSRRSRERRMNRAKYFKDYYKYSGLSQAQVPILKQTESKPTAPAPARNQPPRSYIEQGCAKLPTLTTTTSSNPFESSSTQPNSWLESTESNSQGPRRDNCPKQTNKNEDKKNLIYGTNSVFNLDNSGNVVVRNVRNNGNTQTGTALRNPAAAKSRFSGSLTRTSSSEQLKHHSVDSNLLDTTTTSSPQPVSLSKILLHNPDLVKRSKVVPEVIVPVMPGCVDSKRPKPSLINEMSSSVLFESDTCRSLNRSVTSIDFDSRANNSQKNAESDNRRNLLDEILSYHSQTGKKRKTNRPLFAQNESNTESAVIYNVVKRQCPGASSSTTTTGVANVPTHMPKQVKNSTGETMINANFVRDNKRKVRSAKRKNILKSILRNSKSSVDAWSLMDEDEMEDNEEDDHKDNVQPNQELDSRNNDSSDKPGSRKQVSFSRDICSVRYIK